MMKRANQKLVPQEGSSSFEFSSGESLPVMATRPNSNVAVAGCSYYEGEVDVKVKDDVKEEHGFTTTLCSYSGGKVNVKVEDDVVKEEDCFDTTLVKSEKRFVAELLHCAIEDKEIKETKGVCAKKPATRQARGNGTWIPRSKYKKLKKRLAKAASDQQPAISTSSEVNTEVDKESGKLKRLITESEGLSQVLAKRPNQMHDHNEGCRPSTKDKIDLAVMIHREDDVSLDKTEAAVIRKRLIEHIQEALRAKVGGKKLAFVRSGLVFQGYFLVTPMTEEARSWILGLEFGSINGNPLKISSIRERASIWLPVPEEEVPSDPLEWLVSQNDYKTHLQLSQWTLIHKECLPHGTRLLVSIPSRIIKNQVWLNFQATQVPAHLIKPSKINIPNQKMEIDSVEIYHSSCTDQDQETAEDCNREIVKNELLDGPQFD